MRNDPTIDGMISSRMVFVYKVGAAAKILMDRMMSITEFC